MSNIRKLAIEKSQLPYSIITFREKTDENEYTYIAINPELEGCIAQGDTIEEAQKNLDDVRVDYIEHLLKFDLPIPLPQALTSRTASTSLINEEETSKIDNIIYGETVFEASRLIPN